MTAVVAMGMACLLCLTVIAGFVIRSQQSTIDALADRLMARDYREYSQQQPRPEAKEERRRRPLSWYDDADIATEEEITDGPQ